MKLVSFSFQNYRTFSDPQTLSMVASDSRSKSYDVAHTLTKVAHVQVLPLALIYGADDSGKLHVLGALRAVQEFVLGHGAGPLLPKEGTAEFAAVFEHEGSVREYVLNVDAGGATEELFGDTEAVHPVDVTPVEVRAFFRYVVFRSSLDDDADTDGWLQRLLDVGSRVLVVQHLGLGVHPVLTQKHVRALARSGSVQLIASTHEVTLIDAVRPDEVWLCDPGALCPLSDFKIEGSSRPLSTRYLEGRFGGVPYVWERQPRDGADSD